MIDATLNLLMMGLFDGVIFVRSISLSLSLSLSLYTRGFLGFLILLRLGRFGAFFLFCYTIFCFELINWWGMECGEQGVGRKFFFIKLFVSAEL